MTGAAGSKAPRRPVSRRTARVATAVVLGLFVVSGIGVWQAVAKFGAIDACLDGGGAWHAESGRCAADLAEWRALEGGG
ncbi:MAG: hypothetical protein AAFR52_19640 [Pseudomonadota bacterium]